MNQSVRFVSMIDSRPVQPPYLSLVPYKTFTNGERSVNAAGLDGSTAADQKSKKSIQWNKLLSEDLEELLKQKMAESVEMLKKKQEAQQALTLVPSASEPIKKKATVHSPEKK